jgi:hypothetical protein
MLTEKEIIGNDVVKYAIVASGVVATVVFANLLISKLHDMPKVKENMSYAILISGISIIAIGMIGSQYFKWKQANGKAEDETQVKE